MRDSAGASGGAASGPAAKQPKTKLGFPLDPKSLAPLSKAAAVDLWLNGAAKLNDEQRAPVPVHFRNHRSCEEHAEFIRKEKEVFLKSGAMVKWWSLPWRIHKGKPPKVVIPLHVSFHELKKKFRLCCDARYLNLFIKRYMPHGSVNVNSLEWQCVRGRGPLRVRPVPASSEEAAAAAARSISHCAVTGLEVANVKPGAWTSPPSSACDKQQSHFD